MQLNYDEKRREAFFLLFLALYLGVLFINQTELVVKIPEFGQTIIRGLRYVCYLAFTIKIIQMDQYCKSHLNVMILISFLALLCTISSSHKAALVTVIVCIAAYGCDYHKLIKCSTSVYFIGLITTLLLCFVGILENQLLSDDRLRYNFGFNWVTLASIYMMFIAIGIVNLRGKTITAKEIILLELISYYLYLKTNTRFAFLMTTLFLLVVFAEKCLFNNRWWLLRKTGPVLCLFPFILCGVLFIIQFLYEPGDPHWDAINKVISYRLTLTQDSLDTLHVSLFGQDIEWQGYSLSEGFLTRGTEYAYNNVDCSYFRVMFDYGVVGLLITLFIYAAGIYKAVKYDDQFLVFSYIIVLLFCVTEQWIIELSFNPFILIAAASIFEGSAATLKNTQSFDCVEAELTFN